MGDNPLMMDRRRGSVMLYPGDVEERIKQFDEALDRAVLEESSGGARASSAADADTIAADRDAFLEESQGRGVRVVLEAITERRVQQLRDSHPPRKGDKLDEGVGFNREDFPAAFVRACVVEPEVTDEQWAEFVGEASAGRMRDLHEEAERITFGDVDLPKSSAVFALTRLRERERKRRGVQE